VTGKLEVGPVLIIFVVANGVFVARVMISTVHLPKTVKAIVGLAVLEVVRVLPLLELHAISTTLSKMHGT
jgi:hypothetical protein